MFVLAEMKDVIRVTPEHFHQSLTDSITTLLNRKLANKVVLNVGLCIALFDITDIGHSYIFPGDGSSHTEVKFRYIVFRPILEEIIVGKIKSCSNEGVQVTLGFFDDILIPPNALQHPSRFDESDQAWVWEYPKEDGEKHDLFMDSERVSSIALLESSHMGYVDNQYCQKFQIVKIPTRPPTAPYIPYSKQPEPDVLTCHPEQGSAQAKSPQGETIRFRVTSEVFQESLPNSPPGSDCAAVKSVAPYKIIGGINEPGLGLLTWWESPDQPDGDDDGDEVEE